MTIDEIIADFELLDDWEDRYRYVIELGRALPPFDERLRTDANKVRGCASQVWLATEALPPEPGSTAPRLNFTGDSDAHIVRGLIAILFAVYAEKAPAEILKTDIGALFAKLGLKDHLSAQRANGFSSMVERIRRDAAAVSGHAARA